MNNKHNRDQGSVNNMQDDKQSKDTATNLDTQRAQDTASDTGDREMLERNDM